MKWRRVAVTHDRNQKIHIYSKKHTNFCLRHHQKIHPLKLSINWIGNKITQNHNRTDAIWFISQCYCLVRSQCLELRLFTPKEPKHLQASMVHQPIRFPTGSFWYQKTKTHFQFSKRSLVFFLPWQPCGEQNKPITPQLKSMWYRCLANISNRRLRFPNCTKRYISMWCCGWGRRTNKKLGFRWLTPNGKTAFRQKILTSEK